MSMKNVFKKVLGFFPTPTPVGMQEFDVWSDDIISTYKPAADNRSVKFALATMLLRLAPTEAYKSKRFFALCIHKASAAQVAVSVMEEIKKQQQAEVAAPVVAESEQTQS